MANPAPQSTPVPGEDPNAQRAAWIAAHTPQAQKVDLSSVKTFSNLNVQWSPSDMGFTHSAQPETKPPKAVALDAAFAHPESGHEPVRAKQVQAIPKDGAIQAPARQQ